ncbi:cation:proton antiporter [Furfurilactobacillus sp. WILCCON 0119]
MHSLIGLALPLALIIVAISTPTDATALESVTTGRQFPGSINNTLKMESMFNDATGIILLQAGLLWYQSGHLNLLANSGALLISAIGGLIVGNVVAGLFTLFRQWLVRTSVNNITSQNALYLLSPFIIYAVAEALGVSGIIAVVTAGLVNNSEANRSRFTAPRQMHFGIQMVLFFSELLKGFVFVTLGLNLVRIFRDHYAVVTGSFTWLVSGLVAYLGLFLCRFVYARWFIHQQTTRDATLFALGGVHGTVTLAMTFSLLGNHLSETTFNQIILIETVVIILSMLLPTLIFHWWLPADQTAKTRTRQMNQLRHQLTIIGVETVTGMDLPQDVKDLVIYDLKDQDRHNTVWSFVRQWRTIAADHRVLTTMQSVEQRRAAMTAFTAEQNHLHDLARRGLVDSDIVYDLFSEVLLAESLVLDPHNQLI